ncbi:hypothetical protein ACHAWF_002547 [Thalassiosira exigua]
MSTIEVPAPKPRTTARGFLRACSPHHHPQRWFAVNCAVLIWSLVILYGIWYTSDAGDDDKIIVEWDYLLYNFGACTIWLVEVCFNVLDYKGYFDDGGDEGVGEESLLRPETPPKEERTRGQVIALWVEVALAAYFFVDSTSVAVELTREEIQRYSQGMTLDVCVNMAAYGFIIYRQFVDWRKSDEGNSQAEQTQATEIGSQAVV